MRPRLHFHSDCDFFAGCEQMLPNFWASEQLRSVYDVSFSYRSTPAYAAGLSARARIDFPVHALNLPSAYWIDRFLSHIPRAPRRILGAVSRLLSMVPVFVFDLVVLTGLFMRIRPDVVHINNGGYPGALSCRAAAVASRLAGVPHTLMVVNNMAVPYDRPVRWLEWVLDRVVLSTVDRLVTGSRAASERLGVLGQTARVKATPLHNGIAWRLPSETREETRTRLLIPDNAVVFGVVAVLEARKGHLTLLEAIARLKQEAEGISEPVLVLIEGAGPMLATLEACVAQRGLQDWVRFVGPETNVMNLMQMADVVVLPSIANEDFPNVVLEAMALGKPVVASRLAGTPEQVEDAVTGYLVPPKEPTALADAIRRLANDAVSRKRMGQAGLERFTANFRAEVAVGRYMQLYEILRGDVR